MQLFIYLRAYTTRAKLESNKHEPRQFKTQ
jgi:hypothetical protein